MTRDTPFDRWSALLTASAALVAALLQIGWRDAEAADPPSRATLADCHAAACAAAPHGAPARR